jgi:glutamate-5-semialdehyde dehydrogenase
LNYDRQQTQDFLAHPTQPVDLIIPRGGEKLIEFVNTHATCPVIISGRGNNFVLVDKDADPEMAMSIILNGKLDKISACNAVDKVLIHRDFADRETFVMQLIQKLRGHTTPVEILGDAAIAKFDGVTKIDAENAAAVWQEEFLSYKILIGETQDIEAAIAQINRDSGGHSACIVTTNATTATQFLNEVDCAAVYHNASTRFTDGFQMGLGGELAISTDKLHQRGPIGLQHLVTNKWFVQGTGQVR